MLFSSTISGAESFEISVGHLSSSLPESIWLSGFICRAFLGMQLSSILITWANFPSFFSLNFHNYIWFIQHFCSCLFLRVHLLFSKFNLTHTIKFLFSLTLERLNTFYLGLVSLVHLTHFTVIIFKFQECRFFLHILRFEIYLILATHPGFARVINIL